MIADGDHVLQWARCMHKRLHNPKCYFLGSEVLQLIDNMLIAVDKHAMVIPEGTGREGLIKFNDTIAGGGIEHVLNSPLIYVWINSIMELIETLNPETYKYRRGIPTERAERYNWYSPEHDLGSGREAWKRLEGLGIDPTSAAGTEYLRIKVDYWDRKFAEDGTFRESLRNFFDHESLIVRQLFYIAVTLLGALYLKRVVEAGDASIGARYREMKLIPFEWSCKAVMAELTDSLRKIDFPLGNPADLTTLAETYILLPVVLRCAAIKGPTGEWKWKRTDQLKSKDYRHYAEFQALIHDIVKRYNKMLHRSRSGTNYARGNPSVVDYDDYSTGGGVHKPDGLPRVDLDNFELLIFLDDLMTVKYKTFTDAAKNFERALPQAQSKSFWLQRAFIHARASKLFENEDERKEALKEGEVQVNLPDGVLQRFGVLNPKNPVFPDVAPFKALLKRIYSSQN